MRQGEVYWYRFASPDKRRPVLILTRSDAIPFLHRVVVAAITTTIRGIPSEVRLTPADGVASDCVVSLDNIALVPTAGLGRFVAVLPPDRMREVRTAIEYSLGFREMGR